MGDRLHKRDCIIPFFLRQEQLIMSTSPPVINANYVNSLCQPQVKFSLPQFALYYFDLRCPPWPACQVFTSSRAAAKQLSSWQLAIKQLAEQLAKVKFQNSWLRNIWRRPTLSSFHYTAAKSTF